MIAYLSGKVLAKTNNQIIVKTATGIGYLVTISPLETFLKNENVELFTLTVNKETPELYGFQNINQREWVEKLLKVSGIGPKMAANIIYQVGIDDLVAAIDGSTVETLTRVSGLGAKTAKKIILEFKGANLDLQKIQTKNKNKEPNLKNEFTIDFVDTLSGLGYKRGEIVSLITSLKRAGAWDETNLVETVKRGLELMGKSL